MLEFSARPSPDVLGASLTLIHLLRPSHTTPDGQLSRGSLLGVPQGGGGRGSQLWVLMCKGRDVWELYADDPKRAVLRYCKAVAMCAIKAPFHTGRSQCLTMLTGNIGME